jgi:hypothetical protein
MANQNLDTKRWSEFIRQRFMQQAAAALACDYSLWRKKHPLAAALGRLQLPERVALKPPGISVSRQ